MENIKIAKDMIEVMEYLSDKFGVIVDWGSADFIPYLRELCGKIVAYKEGIAWLWIIVATVLAIVSITFVIIGVVKDCGELVVVGICGIVIAIIIAIINGYTLIACNTFPEKVILDYINSLNLSGISQ